ncbi:MAG: GNAT family N-acetyltransferase [Ruminococcus sp.]
MENELTYELVKNEEDINTFGDLADNIWHEYFPCILEEEQIDYMVDMFFSHKAITDSINDGYEFYFVKLGDKNIGFIAIHPEEEKMFLSKLYLAKEYRGRGYASRMMDFVKEQTVKKGLAKIYLTVNKYNTHTIQVYKHHGFQVIRSAEFNIGKGYIMDDYVMELSL